MKLGSFLDGITPPAGCLLVCHDVRHNDPGGCGNPRCWKHQPGVPEEQYRPPYCRCPIGTFPGEKIS